MQKIEIIVICVALVFWSFVVGIASTTAPPICPSNCTCTAENPAAYVINCEQRPTNFSEIERCVSSESLKNITKLGIIAAHLPQIPLAVCNLKLLQDLELYENEISELPIECFRQLGKLVSFDARTNRITSLPDGLFDNQHMLEQLQLHDNSITYIGNFTFSQTKTLGMLKFIDLTVNKLRTLDSWVFVRAQVQPGVIIKLAFNYIDTFTNNGGFKHQTCKWPNTTMTLDLQWNNVKHVTDVKGLGFTSDVDMRCFDKKRPKILLQSNNFECDCKDFEIAVLARNSHSGMFDQLFCGDNTLAKAMADTTKPRLLTIALEDIICALNQSCPPGCQLCAERPFNRTCHIKCRNAGLTSMPQSLPFCPLSYSYQLDFSGNQITELEYRNYLEKTVVFDVSDNPVKKIDYSTRRLILNEVIKDAYLPESAKGVLFSRGQQPLNDFAGERFTNLQKITKITSHIKF